MARRSRQPGLRSRSTCPSERAKDRPFEMSRKILRLVEAASEAAPRMEWHGHDAISVAEHVVARRAHHRAEPRGKCPPAFVFERVDDGSQRTGVAARCVPLVDHAGRHCRCGRQCAQHLGPARLAYGTACWMYQWKRAGRALW